MDPFTEAWLTSDPWSWQCVLVEVLSPKPANDPNTGLGDVGLDSPLLVAACSFLTLQMWVLLITHVGNRRGVKTENNQCGTNLKATVTSRLSCQCQQNCNDVRALCFEFICEYLKVTFSSKSKKHVKNQILTIMLSHGSVVV